MLGILAASYIYAFDGSISPVVVMVTVMTAAAGAFFYFRQFRSDHRLLLSLIALAGLLLGLLIYGLSFPSINSVAYVTGSDARLSGTVVKARVAGSYQQLMLDEILLDDHARQDRLLVFAPLFPELRYGDRIVLPCELEAPEPYEGFRYDRFLASKDIYATCFTHDAPLRIATDQGNPVKAVLMDLRGGIIESIDKTFGEPHGSLLAGLLLGEQRFTEEWEEAFLQTGTTHIVAASGYNVSVVMFVAFGILTYLGIRRQRAFGFLLTAIVAYMMLAGAEAPVVRAGIMGVLVLISRQLGRKSAMTNVLLLTAAGMLFINPRLLRDDVGFQLSMLSTVALIYFAPYLGQRFKFIPEAYTIRESLTATLSATLFTLPVVFLNFARLSVVGPFANLLILPLVPYAMWFGGLAVLLGFAWQSLGAIMSGPAWALLSLILWVAESMAALPFSSFELPQLAIYPLAIISSCLIVILWKRFSSATVQPS